jgi:hypothetical protein
MPDWRVALWKERQVLIVDEISMVQPVLLDALSRGCCRARNPDGREDTWKTKGAAFGGMPLVIFAGDFMQLKTVGGASAQGCKTEQASPTYGAVALR